MSGSVPLPLPLLSKSHGIMKMSAFLRPFGDDRRFRDEVPRVPPVIFDEQFDDDIISGPTVVDPATGVRVRVAEDERAILMMSEEERHSGAESAEDQDEHENGELCSEDDLDEAVVNNDIREEWTKDFPICPLPPSDQWRNKIVWGNDIYEADVEAERHFIPEVDSDSESEGEMSRKDSRTENGNDAWKTGGRADRSLETGRDEEERLVFATRIPALWSGSWLGSILWEPTQKVPKPKLIYPEGVRDAQLRAIKTPRPVLKEMTVAVEPGTEDVSHERENRAKMAEAKKLRLTMAARNTGFSYNADTYAKGAGTEQEARAVEVPPVVHSAPAQNKILTRIPKGDDARHYHRPRYMNSTLVEQQHWHLKVIRGKANTLKSDGHGMASAMRGGVVFHTMHSEKDLIPLEHDSTFVLIEYAEERPPILSDTGMASRLINWYRPPTNAASTLISATRPVGGRPVGRAGARLPVLPDGQTRELTAQEDSPFVGSIRPGTCQPSICSDLYRAPLFQHKARDTDFLLIRDGTKAKKKGPNGQLLRNQPFTMIVREIPRVYLAGQTEPLIEVLEPSEERTRAFLEYYVEFQVAKLFNEVITKGPNENPRQDKTKVREMFKYVCDQKNRYEKYLREIADEVIVAGGAGGQQKTQWVLKHGIDIEEHMSKAAQEFSPEDVCSYESMLAGHRRLMDAGIQLLTSADSVSKVLIRLKARHDNLQASLKEVRALIEESNKQQLGDKGPSLQRLLYLKKLLEVLEKQEVELSHCREVGQYIHEELQLVPWFISSSFVRVQLKGQGQMRLAGVGDPSGCGEGFSYAAKPPETGQQQRNLLDKLADTKVTGTSGDLRKLKMPELERQLVELGMAREEVTKLKRWDRVHFITVLANMAVTNNAEDAASVHRFTRKPRKSSAGEKKQYKHSIQDIWDRQCTALSMSEEEVRRTYSETSKAAAAAKGESQDEEDFEDDLLGGVEEEGEGTTKQSMQDIMRKGPTTSHEAVSREEEEEYKKYQRSLAQEQQLKAAGGGSSNETGGDSSMGTGPASTLSASEQYHQSAAQLASSFIHERPNKVVKRITRSINEAGVETTTISFIFDKKEVKRVSAAAARQRSPLNHLIPETTYKEEEDVGFDLGDEERPTTINLTGLRKKVEDHQQFKKRKRIQDQEDQKNAYKVPRAASSTRSRGGGMGRSAAPEVELASKLEGIAVSLLSRPDSGAFSVKPTRTEPPGYLEMIKRPIDLTSIKQKCTAFVYKSHHTFLDDLELLSTNAAAYNGVDSPFTRIAATIYADGKRLVAQISTELEELSSKIAEMSNTKKSTRGKGKGNAGRGGAGRGGRGGGKGKKKGPALTALESAARSAPPAASMMIPRPPPPAFQNYGGGSAAGSRMDDGSGTSGEEEEVITVGSIL